MSEHNDSEQEPKHIMESVQDLERQQFQGVEPTAAGAFVQAQRKVWELQDRAVALGRAGQVLGNEEGQALVEQINAARAELAATRQKLEDQDPVQAATVAEALAEEREDLPTDFDLATDQDDA